MTQAQIFISTFIQKRRLTETNETIHTLNRVAITLKGFEKFLGVPAQAIRAFCLALVALARPLRHPAQVALAVVGTADVGGLKEEKMTVAKARWLGIHRAGGVDRFVLPARRDHLDNVRFLAA